ncbi:MAG: TonB-dependent receptor [Caulobacter sp.]|nr:TonB-dependent receptor [Caulobacter sp.]
MAKNVRADRTHLRRLLTGTGLAALMVPGLAWAQQADEPTKDPLEVEEVVVTAQRREEKLQDVPAAISAFTGEQLSGAGVDDIKELTQVTPGLFVTQGGLSPQPTIRGIGARGNNPSDEGTVPVYIDGVYQPFSRAGFPKLNNVERVEVLKGPQGTILGRNATGGAINLITKRPKAGFGYDVEAGYGSFDAYSLRAYLTGGSDTLAADLAFGVFEDDGYVTNPVTNEDLGKRKGSDIRVKVLWTPTDWLEMTFAASRRRDADNRALATQPLDDNINARRTNPGVFYPTKPYQSSLSFVPIADNTQEAASITTLLKFDNFDITSISGWQKNWQRNRSDADMTTLNIGFLDYVQYGRTFSEELYISSAGDGPFQWLAGTFIFDDVSGYNPITRATSTYTRAPTFSIAYYGQVSYAFTDQWKLTAGGRYTNEERDYSAHSGATYVKADTAEFEEFTPSATLEFTPSEDYKVYLRYGEAFKSGVFTTNGLTTSHVLPENVRSWELGVKTDPLPNLRINAAIFHTEYENIQLTAKDPLTAASFLQNAAASTLNGGEIEVTWRVTPELQIRGGVSVIDAKFDSFPGAQINSPRPGNTGGNVTAFIDAAGNTMPKIPENTVNLAADYSRQMFGGDFGATLSVLHVGEFTWDSANRLTNDAYDTVNGELSWASPQGWEVTLWGENLTDELYLTSVVISAEGDAASYGSPRAFGVRLRYRWH